MEIGWKGAQVCIALQSYVNTVMDYIDGVVMDNTKSMITNHEKVVEIGWRFGGWTGLCH